MLVSFSDTPNQVLTTFFDANDLKRLACTSRANKEKVYRALHALFTKFVPQNAQLSEGQVSEYFGEKLISYGKAVEKLDSFENNLSFIGVVPQEILFLFLPQGRIFEAKVSMRNFQPANDTLLPAPDDLDAFPVDFFPLEAGELVEGQIEDIFSKMEEWSKMSSKKFDSESPNHFVVFENGKVSPIDITDAEIINGVIINITNPQLFLEKTQQIDLYSQEATSPYFFERDHFSVSYKGLLATVMVVAAVVMGSSYLSE